MSGPRRSIWAIIAALGLAFAGIASAAPAVNTALGRTLAVQGAPDRGAPACQSCHGPNGEGEADIKAPRLAGLDAGYLARQLAALASGARRNDIMGPVARNLTATQQGAVAAYYARLPDKAAPAQTVDVAAAARGQHLAEAGKWSAGLPPCAACHGADGLGVGAVTPALTGQPAAYLETALNDWRTGARSGDPLGLMGGIAKRLTPAEAHDAAAYYASRPLGPAAKQGKAR